MYIQLVHVTFGINSVKSLLNVHKGKSLYNIIYKYWKTQLNNNNNNKITRKYLIYSIFLSFFFQKQLTLCMERISTFGREFNIWYKIK